jgi:hypothetical protein
MFPIGTPRALTLPRASWQREMNLKTITALLKMGLLSAMLCCFALAQETTGSRALFLTSIIQEMEKAQTEVRPQPPYQVIREYWLFGANSSSADSVVVAAVDFTPPRRQNYNIQSWSGSSRGEQVVRRILDMTMWKAVGYRRVWKP